MKSAVRATHGPEVLGGVGGFAGLFDARALRAYRHPLLATSTDGVGTKVAIAQAIDKHDTIGLDLVGMVVDDIVVVGATPLFMTDYIACGKVFPERIADIVARHRARMRRHRHRARRRRDRRASRAPGPERLRRRGRGDRRRRSRRRARCRARGRRRRRPRARLERPALQRLLARAPHRRRRGDRLRTSNAADFGTTWGEALLEPTRLYTRRCCASSISSAAASTRSATSPAAASRPTSHGCCRRAPGSRSTARRGHRRRCSACSPISAVSISVETEGTWNLGIGFLAVVSAERRMPRSRRSPPTASPRGRWVSCATTRGPRASSNRAPRASTAERCASSARIAGIRHRTDGAK